MGKLQEFNGYYVDYRLNQFRSAVPFPEVIEFIEFSSEKGDTLLSEMLKQGLVSSENMSLIKL